MIAARVAAGLRRSGESRVEMRSGGLGEIRVTVDGRDVYVGSRWWYPSPSEVVSTVEEAIRSQEC